MPYDGVRDAAHQRSPDTAKAPAPHDDQTCPDLLTQMDYLLVRFSPEKVGLRHAHPFFFDPIYLLVEKVLGLVHGFLELMFEHPAWTRGYGVREGPLYGGGEHVCYVQLRVGAVGHIRSGGKRQARFARAVCGQQDLRRKYAHRGNLLTLRSFLEHHDAISRNWLHLCLTSRDSAAGQPFNPCVDRTLVHVSSRTIPSLLRQSSLV